MPFGLGFFATAGAGAAGSFDLLESQVLGSDTASVTFSSLSTYASTYQHLQVRYVIRGTRASDAEAILTRLNGDSGNNYSSHTLSGNGSSVGSGSQTSFSAMELNYSPAATTTANVFGPGIMDFLDAFETTKYKTRRTFFSMGVHSGFSEVSLNSSLWMNTAAISSISFTPRYGSAWATGSRFSLYGIKVA